MNLLHTADLHIGLHRYSRTLDEQLTTLGQIADIALERNVDAVLVSGDVFHSQRPSAEQILGFIRLVRRMTGEGIPVLISPGNHDGPGSIHDPATKTAAWLAAVSMPEVHAFPEPSANLVQTRSGKLFVLALPYAHKRSLDTKGDDPLRSIEERQREVGQRLEQFIEAMAVQSRVDAPRIVMAHVSTAAASLGEERAMLPGWDVFVRPDVFAGFDYAALGHIHVQQQVAPNAWYAGAPEQHDFGDAETHPRGVLLVELEEGGVPAVTPVPVTGRRLVTIDLQPALDPSFYQGEFAGAAVRVRVDGPASAAWQREVGRRIRAAGASWHEIRLVRVEQRPRRLAIAPEAEAVDALRAHLKARGLPDEPYVTAARALLEEGW